MGVSLIKFDLQHIQTAGNSLELSDTTLRSKDPKRTPGKLGKIVMSRKMIWRGHGKNSERLDNPQLNPKRQKLSVAQHTWDSFTAQRLRP